MPDTPPTTAGGAVFLSYAREDIDAARRAADALRAFGVEVWFDQSELRGGDAWDAKIKQQIRECTLFLALVSAHTQGRREGYFRREWNLAVERTLDMAHGTPFLLPVVVDDTPESGAVVPEQFLRVQWTRLPQGVPTPEFVAQVKRLLEAPRRSAAGRRSDDGRQRTEDGGPAVAKPMAGRRRTEVGRVGPKKRVSAKTLFIGAFAILAIAVAVWLWQSRKAGAVASGNSPSVAAKPPLDLASDAGSAKADAKSIAVLPFENLSPDKDNAFFADGMHDEVITALAKIHDLTVISRLSVMAFRKPEGRNLKNIAAELGVASVLEGSVQRSGNKVKVIVQLIDARTDRHLWAETYTEDLTDVFTIQSKLAGAITTALKATLSPQEKSLIARRPTQNQEAYDFYLRARAMSETMESTLASRKHYDSVVALYEQAIARDPAFALAHVQLCVTHGLLYFIGSLDPTPARRDSTKAALDAAQRLAPDLPETRLAQGAYFYRCENNWSRALAEFRAAEAGLPNDAQLVHFIGITQRRLGRLKESLAYIGRSVKLNPGDRATQSVQIVTLRMLRRFSEAGDLALHYVELFPNTSDLLGDLAVARLEIERDRAAYFGRLEANPAIANDPQGLEKAYRVAMARDDFAAADRALADPRLTFVRGTNGIINEPVTLHRALVGFLRGQRDASRAYADEAIAFYRAQQFTPRQEPWVMIGTAFAHALAGRADEAVRLAREGFALLIARDAFDSILQRPDVAHVYLVLDRREEALAVLREMMTGPCPVGPEEVRLDPFWSRLKDDPRFEEILKLAKPL